LSVVSWWEARRIPYNVIVGALGLVSLVVFFVSISTSGRLQPGEDAVEPIALLFAPIAANVCYTAGWLVEVPLRFVRPSLCPGFTAHLFRLGIAFSLFVISLPAVIWGGYRLLQIVPLVR
jgi:hypothetical protein